MWNTSVVVPAVPIPVLPPPLPMPAGSVPLSGQRIAVLGQGRAARAIAAELSAKGATATVHPPSHRFGSSAGDAAGPQLDGILVLLPAKPRPSSDTGRLTTDRPPLVSDTVVTAIAGMTAGSRPPRWVLLLTPRTDPAEATRAVLALSM